MIAALERLDVAVAEWLAQRDPALAHLPEAMAAADPRWSLHDVQWTPGRGCRLAYAAESPGSGGWEFIAVHVDPMTWSQRDYRGDQDLPGLRPASDPTLVADELRMIVEEPILHCRVEPVRYRPGSRCVLRYDVQTASGAERYYAKVFTKSVFSDASGRARRVSAAAEPAGPQLARVLAVWPELYTTVGAAVDGRSASSVLRDATVTIQDRVALAELLGGLLADFHALTGVPVPVRTASDQLRALTDLTPAVRLLDPAFADGLRRLLDRLERALPLPDHPEVLIHGAFRPGQVVVDDAGLLHLLDLDGVSRGDAAEDLATAFSHLSWQAVRQPSQHAELGLAQQALLAGYAARGLAVSEASLAWWRAAALAQIAARRFRRLEIADWHLVPQLIDLAESLLDGRADSEAP